MSKENKKKRDIAKDITNQIREIMKEGTPPWRKPWQTNLGGFSLPHNGQTGRQYRGINRTLLMCHPNFVETGNGEFYTFNQIKENGWSLDKGTKGFQITYVGEYEVENEDPDTNEEPTKKKYLKTYPVWHASQINGWKAKEEPVPDTKDWQKVFQVEATVEASGADVQTGGIKAFYNRTSDHIQIPERRLFESEEAWASTILHEMGHWTGHEDRLNRQFGVFGDEAYAKEELRAELASVFICAELGINPELAQHASYVENWMSVLEEDKYEIFRAAADAQRISDYVMEYVPKLKTDMELAEAAELPNHLREELGIDNPVTNPPFDVSAPVYGGPGL